MLHPPSTQVAAAVLNWGREQEAQGTVVPILLANSSLLWSLGWSRPDDPSLCRFGVSDYKAAIKRDLKSIGLHKLSGDRGSQWAMTINGPWRLVFSFQAGHAFDVEIVDYHAGE